IARRSRPSRARQCDLAWSELNDARSRVDLARRKLDSAILPGAISSLNLAQRELDSARSCLDLALRKLDGRCQCGIQSSRAASAVGSKINQCRKQKMSGANNEDIKEQELTDNTVNNQVDVDSSVDDLNKALDKNDENPMPSPQQEEEIVKKKYGGLLPKKHPLISKDHERAFFDSADWALGKQGAQKPKGPLEALRPKLQPTPHQQVRSRRSAYAPADEGGEVDGSNNHSISSEDQSCMLDAGEHNDTTSEGFSPLLTERQMFTRRYHMHQINAFFLLLHVWPVYLVRR
ncbi:hypothetical protein CMV_030145, partial [Castanea mollissima]